MPTGSSAQTDYPLYEHFEFSRRETVFSTFNQAIKWNSLGFGQTSNLKTSNFFTMPNLPSEYGGFHIQIGPGNSDHKFNSTETELYEFYGNVSMIGGAQNKLYPPNGHAYWGYNSSTETLHNGNNGGLGTGDNIPFNFGVGLPWRMANSLYGEVDEALDLYNYYPANGGDAPDGNYAFWFNEYDLGYAPGVTHYFHPNKPTLADENVYLNTVELVRYAKNPYMLKSVKTYRTSKENLQTVLSNQDFDLLWKLVAEKQLNYEIRQVPRYVIVEEMLTNLKVEQRGNRNLVLLKNVKEIPVGNGITYNIDEVPTTHFDYAEQQYVTDGQTAANVYQTNFLAGLDLIASNQFLLNKITNPLGGETEIDYTFGYVVSQYYGTPKYEGSVAGVIPKIHVLNSYANQIYHIVTAKRFKDKSGTTKEWTYNFQNLTTYNDQNYLPANYTENVQYNIKKGYEIATVYQPQLTVANIPYIKYYHHIIDNSYTTDVENTMFWGKVYKVENYDGDGELLAKSEKTYDFIKAYRNGLAQGNQDWFDNYEYESTIGNFNNHKLKVPSRHRIQVADADFYEINYSDIESNKPEYLSSFFVFLDSEENTAYDKKCNCNEELEMADEEPRVGDDEEEEFKFRKRMSVPTIDCNEAISTVTEYGYFDAQDDGSINAHSGYALLLKENTVFYKNNLKFEPSWQLARTKTYSNDLPDAYTEEEYFYYYDLMNHSWYVNHSNSHEPSADFSALYNMYNHRMRNIPFEKRVTTKAAGQTPITNVSYLFYDGGWTTDGASMTTWMNNNQVSDIYNDNYPCTGLPTLPAGCILSNSGTPPTGYCDHKMHHPLGDVYCPCLESEDLPSTLGPVARQSMQNYLDQRVWLRSTYVSTENIYGITTDLMIFSTSTGPSNAHTDISVDYNRYVPFFSGSSGEVIKNYEVLDYIPTGWIHREMDVKGTITRYDYTPVHEIHYYYCHDYEFNQHQRVHVFENYGTVAAVTVAEGSPNELTTHYTYNYDGSIATITDPNNLVLSYDYDEYRRMTRAYRNGDLLQEVNYSKWNNDDLLTFEQKTMQNYVETISHNDLSGSNYALARAYVDPLGRNALTAASVSNARNDLVVSAYTQFDSWDRPTHIYKPFTLNVANGMSSLSYTTPQNQINASSPHIAKVYQDDPRSRILKEAKYGNNINGNRIATTDFCILNGEELRLELGLSTALMAGWVVDVTTTTPIGLHKNLFLKSTITDEDQKFIIEYANAIGQKIASVRYINSLQILTLFYYDSKGNLTKVINPKSQASDYIYNDLGMLFKKHTLDGGTIHAIFDKSGQVILEQDENGLADGYIRGYEYDDMGRMIRQVRITSYDANLFSNITYDTYKSLSWRNPVFDGTNLFSPTNYTVEKEWFYGSNSFSKNNSTFLTQTRNYLNNSLSNAKGNLTHTISYNLSGLPIEYRFMSYTDDGYAKWELTQFSQTGITTATPGFAVRADFAEYGLQGNLRTQNMDLDGNGSMDFQYHYTYDQWSRLKEIFISYNNLKTNGYKVAEYQYDDALGLVTELSYFDSESNTCKNQLVDRTTYSYDVRDRLTHINSQLFEWSLYYDNQSPTGTPLQQNWNGNVNATRARYKLSSATNAPTNFTTQAYTDYQYEYDPINRLKRANADMHNGTPNSGTHGNTAYQYDKVGNITRLDRNNGLFTDRYRYQYQTNTNKMVGIAVDEVFVNTQNTNVTNYTYNYDNNGNLTYDSKRDITVTGYGRANLPWTLSTKPSNISYLYSIADLRVYKKEAAKASGGDLVEDWYLRIGGMEVGIFHINSGKFTWYIHGSERIAKVEHQLNGDNSPAIIGGSFGELVYTSEQPPLEPSEEDARRGEEIPRGGPSFSETLTLPSNPPVPDLVFYIYDHLGNTRVTYSTAVTCGGNTSIAYTLEAVLDYYPYGKILREYANGEGERYLTTQHERDKETGLDYRGARFYDADVARFLSLDPLAADFPAWSDYNYVIGNPIHFTDPDGKKPCPEGVDCTEPLENMRIRRNRASNLGPGHVRNDGTRFHAGHDLYAQEGTNVMSVMDGEVHTTGYSSSYGNYVTIKHTVTTIERSPLKGEPIEITTTYYSMYAHLSDVDVNTGDAVTMGQVIGQSGTTGYNARGLDEHLHYEFGTELRHGRYPRNLLDPNISYKNIEFSSLNSSADQTDTGVLKTEKADDGTIQSLTIQPLSTGSSHEPDRVIWRNTEGCTSCNAVNPQPTID